MVQSYLISSGLREKRKRWTMTRDCSTVKRERSLAAKNVDNFETKYLLVPSAQEERVCIATIFDSTLTDYFIEYISQLEGEVAAKTNEAAEYKRMNSALMQENARYKLLAEKLLAHSAFHPFLEELSRDPALAETLSSVSASSVALQQSRSQMTLIPLPLDSSLLLLPIMRPLLA